MNIPAHFLQNAAKSPVLNVSFNGNATLFSSAENEGWRIWHTATLAPVARKDIPNGSLSLVMPLENSNIIFLVGGPPSPLHPPNKVMVYDVAQSTVVASLEFKSTVLGLAARRDRLIVVLKRRVILFGLPIDGPIYREGNYETAFNPLGLLALASNPETTLMCVLGLQPGYVSLIRLPPLRGAQELPSNALPRPKNPPFPSTAIVVAHRSALSALSCTPDGSCVATASRKGTIIRVWDAKTGAPLYELRRGTDPADIFSLAFKRDGGALACASDKGTVHVWILDATNTNSLGNTASRERSINSQRQSTTPNPSTSFESNTDLLKPFLPKYFHSKWSDAQFRLPPPEPQPARTLPFLDQLSEEKRDKALTVETDRSVVCWPEKDEHAGVDDEDVLVIITRSGGWFKLALTSDSRKRTEELGFGAQGKCRMISYQRFEQRDGW